MEFLGKISNSYKRSRSDEEALRYLPYDEKAAEFALLNLSRRLFRGLDVRASLWSRCWNALLGVKRLTPGIKVVFVLDELDKLDSQKIRYWEVEERLVEDISRDKSIYTRALSPTIRIFRACGMSRMTSCITAWRMGIARCLIGKAPWHST